MPPKVKVPKKKQKKTQRLLPFCTTNAESGTTNFGPEDNDQDKASKPPSSKNEKSLVNVSLTTRELQVCYVQFIHNSHTL